MNTIWHKVKQIIEETKIKGNLYMPQGNKKNKLEIPSVGNNNQQDFLLFPKSPLEAIFILYYFFF